MRSVLIFAVAVLGQPIGSAQEVPPDPNVQPYLVQPQPGEMAPGAPGVPGVPSAPGAPAMAASPDGATSFGYVGPHPIPNELGGGFCTIEGAHTHEYPPFDQYLFRETGGYYYFVGDPADFGYGGNSYWFNGNHPLPPELGGGYCYISWPHRHAYEPQLGDPGYSLVGGYWVFLDPFPEDYFLWRDFYWGYFFGYYRSNYYGNRYYTVRPPPVYAPRAPVRVAAPPGRVIGPPPAVSRPNGTRGQSYGGINHGPPRAGQPVQRSGFVPGQSNGFRPGAAPTVNRAVQSSYAPTYHPSYAQPNYAQPTYRYAAPSYSAPAYHYSAPSYRPAYTPPAYTPPAYHYSAPTYHAPAASAPAPAYHYTPPAPAPAPSAPHFSPSHSGGFGGGGHRR